MTVGLTTHITDVNLHATAGLKTYVTVLYVLVTADRIYIYTIHVTTIRTTIRTTDTM